MSKPEMKSNRKFTDFVLLPKFGKELKCHKFVLVENSPVFEAMLTQDFEEAITNEMKLDDFDEETVSTFLEYLYTPAKDKAFDSVTAELIRTGPQGNVYKRTFEKERLTPELLKMSFKYQVDDLQKDCIEYLKAHINNDSTALMLLEIASAFEMNDLGEICVKYLEEEINDANVMEILKVAARCDNKAVYSRAKQHLLDRPQGKSLKDVPGFFDDSENQGRAMLDLLDGSVQALSNQRESLMNSVKAFATQAQELNKVKAELDQQTKAVIKVKTKAHNYKEERDTLTNDLRKAKAEILEANNKLNQVTAKASQLENIVKSAAAARDNLKKEVDKAERVVKAVADDAANSKSEELNKVKAELERQKQTTIKVKTLARNFRDS